MTKQKISKEQIALERKIQNILRRPFGFRYVPKNWDKKLWSKPTGDIYDFLEGVFAKTTDVVEYYSAMVFLYRHTSNELLLVDFHDSPQWHNVAETYKHLTENKTSNRIEHKPTGLKESTLTTPKIEGTEQIMEVLR